MPKVGMIEMKRLLLITLSFLLFVPPWAESQNLNITKQTMSSNSSIFLISGRALVGDATDIVIDSTYAYVATTTGLLVLDISISDSIIIVSNSYFDPSSYTFCDPVLSIENGYVYLTTGNILRVIDITNPIQPIEAINFNLEGGTCFSDVIADSPYVYLGERFRQEVVILEHNATDSLAIISIIDIGDVRGLFLSDEMLYIAIGFGGDLHIYSVSDPRNPIFQGTFYSWNVANNVFVENNKAYLANGSRGLRILDVSNPTNPFELGFYDPQVSIYNVIVKDSIAITSSSGAGFRILDVSNPATPSLLSRGNPGGTGMQIQDDYLYIAQPKTYHDNIGVQVFDITNPENPILKSRLITGANYNDIVVHSDTIYVIGWDFGIQIFPDDSIFDPTDITTVDFPHAEEMVFYGNLAALLGFEGVRLLDWKNSNSPEVLSSITTPFEAQEVEFADSLLYVASGVELSSGDFPGAFQIYDISDTKNPFLVSTATSDKPYIDMELYQDHAFIIEQSSGIKIFDVIDEYSPIEVGFISGDYNGITIYENIAFVTSDESIYAYELIDPSQPSILSICDVGGSHLSETFISDGLLFAKDSHAIYALDISIPSSCNLLSEFILPAYIESIFLGEEKLYVSTFQRGIYIVSYTNNPIGVTFELTSKIGDFNLHQNFPNPFNPVTTINYSLPRSGDVTLIVYNLLGEEVTRLVDGFQQAGEYNSTWNAINVPSSIYFYRLQTRDFVQTKKMVLLK